MSKIKVIILVLVVILLSTSGCIVWHCCYYFIRTSSVPVHAKENKDSGIAVFHSSVDKDGYVIDDQVWCLS